MKIRVKLAIFHVLSVLAVISCKTALAQEFFDCDKGIQALKQQIKTEPNAYRRDGLEQALTAAENAKKKDGDKACVEALKAGRWGPHG